MTIDCRIVGKATRWPCSPKKRMFVTAWEDLKTVALKFSTEAQMQNGEPCSAVTLKQLSDGEYAVLDGFPRHIAFFKPGKLHMEVDGKQIGWVKPVLDECLTAIPQAPIFYKLRFEPAE